MHGEKREERMQNCGIRGLLKHLQCMLKAFLAKKDLSKGVSLTFLSHAGCIDAQKRMRFNRHCLYRFHSRISDALRMPSKRLARLSMQLALLNR